jgi:cysteine synthase
VSPQTQIILADPPGSSLFHRVKSGVCYTSQQSERTLKRNRYDTIVEGVGIDRITANFECAIIDEAIRVSDQDTLDMAHWILKHEGLLIGSSSALNITATCIYASQLKQQQHGKGQDASLPPKKLVTVICDSGTRHLSRFWNPDYVHKYNLQWPSSSSSSGPAVLPNIPKCLVEYLK